MTGIRPVKLGISGATLTLIACGVWFVATNQTSDVQRRAFEARDVSLAATRAAQNGVSVEEMKRRAYAACLHVYVDPGASGTLPPRDGGVLYQDTETALRDAAQSSCISSYIYGNDVMHDPTFDLFKQWVLLVLKIVFISAGVGAAVAATFKGGQSWWNWLRTN